MRIFNSWRASQWIAVYAFSRSKDCLVSLVDWKAGNCLRILLPRFRGIVNAFNWGPIRFSLNASLFNILDMDTLGTRHCLAFVRCTCTTLGSDKSICAHRWIWMRFARFVLWCGARNKIIIIDIVESTILRCDGRAMQKSTSIFHWTNEFRPKLLNS